MHQEANALRFELHGEDKSAATAYRQAHEYAARADELWKPPDKLETGLGEVVPPKAGWVTDTLKTPDAVTRDASAHRIELLDHLGNDCVALALDAAESVKAKNSLEKMLCHQLVVAHKTALEIMGKAVFDLDSLTRARNLNLAARFMDTYQRGLLTFQRIRSGGEQTIIVKQVTVTDGGQAVVGNVRAGGDESK
jgi:hypothetical protein